MATVASTTSLAAQAPDGVLLERYVRVRDEAAFAELVARHGPLVWSVCRRLTAADADADDACQCVFMLLVRDAARIRRRESVGAWLYGVARRTALRSALRHARRRERALVDVGTESDLLDDVARRHALRVLDEELARLPARYREPLTLHYMLGKSREETASALGLSDTVVKGRLQRGRNELRLQLRLRGVSLATVVAALGAWAAECGAAPLPDVLPDAASAAGDGATRVRDTPYQETGTMLTAITSAGCALSLAILGLSSWRAHAPAAELIRPAVIHVAGFDGVSSPAFAAEPAAATMSAQVVVAAAVAVQQDEAKQDAQAGDPNVVKYHDDQADGRKSIAGSGEMILFELPAAGRKVRGVRIHGSRYGAPQAPKEDFHVHILSEDGSESLYTADVPYSRFSRGDAKWVRVGFPEAVEVPKKFWVVLEFNAEQTKGVYVSYDTSTGGQRSRVGLPGEEPREVGFDGDWMVEALLEK